MSDNYVVMTEDGHMKAPCADCEALEHVDILMEKDRPICLLCEPYTEKELDEQIAKARLKEISLNEGELATVLAALRWWQSSVYDPKEQYEKDIGGHFHAVPPITHEKIDELCERINI